MTQIKGWDQLTPEQQDVVRAAVGGDDIDLATIIGQTIAECDDIGFVSVLWLGGGVRLVQTYDALTADGFMLITNHCMIV